MPALLWGGVRIVCALDDREAARPMLVDLQSRHAESVFTPLTEAFLRGLDGDDQARGLIEDSHLAWAKDAAEWAQFMSDLYAVVGAFDEALHWLKQAYRVGFLNERFLAEGNPLLAPLRGLPEFDDLVEKMRVDRVELERSVERVQCAS